MALQTRRIESEFFVLRSFSDSILVNFFFLMPGSRVDNCFSLKRINRSCSGSRFFDMLPPIRQTIQSGGLFHGEKIQSTFMKPNIRHMPRIILWPKSGFRYWFGQLPGMTLIPLSRHIFTASCETLVMPAARPGLVPIMQCIQTCLTPKSAHCWTICSVTLGLERMKTASGFSGMDFKSE